MSTQNNQAITVPEGILIPGPIGRVLRIVTGIGQAWFIISVLPHYRFFMSDAIPTEPMYWLAVIAVLWVVNPVVNIGFNVEWNGWPRNTFLGLAGIAIIFNLFQSGAIWGPPPNFLIFMFAVYVHVHLGIAHILSGILGTPGCEMRAIPQLWAMLTKGETEAHTCPAFWSFFDRWEANLKKQED